MKVLLTNDDGIDAPGIQALCRAFSSANWAEVYVVAPNGNRSGASQSITTHTPISVEQRQIDGVEAAYAIGGTPTDCVKVAFQADLADEFPKAFDMVVSGINYGPNIGADTMYSGTVGAAREAALHGIPAVATSLALLEHPGLKDYDSAARFICEFIGNHRDEIISGTLGDLPVDSGSIFTARAYNLNIPDVVYEDIKGLKYTSLSRFAVFNEFREVKLEDGTRGFLPCKMSSDPSSPDSDIEAIREGYASLSIL